MKMKALFAVLFLSAQAAQAFDIKTPAYESRPKFYKEGGEVKGLCIDVLKAVEANASELHFTIDYGVPLKRVESGTKEGTYDLLLCATPTPDRSANLRMIDIPIYQVDDVLIVRADDPIMDATLNDIRQLPADNVVMTYAGTGQQTWLSEQKGLSLDIAASTPEAVFQKLGAKRGRFVFVGEAIAANMMKQPAYSGKFRVLPTPVRRAGRFFFFSKKTPLAVVNKVEVALKDLNAKGELKKIASRYALE